MKKITLISLTFLLSNMSMAALKDCQNPYTLKLINNFKMKFCELPEGKAIIGSDLVSSEKGHCVYSDQTVACEERELDYIHRVDGGVPVEKEFKKFYMGQFEVSVGQYEALFKNHNNSIKSSHYKSQFQNKDQAIFGLSFNEMNDFANLLNELDPTATYRLPTEAEWEYAAKAGTQTRYYWGDEFDNLMVAHSNLYDQINPIRTDCPNKILNKKTPGYCANGFGLMNMLGNLAEMTVDEFVAVPDKNRSNGHEIRRDGIPVTFVIRGGSFLSDKEHLTVFDRHFYFHSRSQTASDVGFRLVRIPKI